MRQNFLERVRLPKTKSESPEEHFELNKKYDFRAVVLIQFFPEGTLRNVQRRFWLL